MVKSSEAAVLTTSLFADRRQKVSIILSSIFFHSTLLQTARLHVGHAKPAHFSELSKTSKNGYKSGYSGSSTCDHFDLLV